MNARVVVTTTDWFNNHHWNSATNTNELGFYKGFTSLVDGKLKVGDIQESVRCILALYGIEPMRLFNADGASYSPYYAIPIPSDASTITINCEQSEIEYAVLSRIYDDSENTTKWSGDSGFQSGQYIMNVPIHPVYGRSNFE